MNAHDDLFAYAERLKERGMLLASDSEERHNPGFGAMALQTIRKVALRQPTVHVDDVLEACPVRPRHPNAWGAVWSRAQRTGIIRRTAELRRCKTDPGKHAHAYPVYASLLFGRIQ